MKLSIVYKFSLSMVIVVLASSTIIGSFFYSKTTDLLVTATLNDISEEVQNTGTRLQNRIKDLHEEVLIVSKAPPIQGLLRANNSKEFDNLGNSSYQQWRSRLESIFTTILNSKPAYLTIRFINEQGQELAVASRLNNKIITLNDSDLQNKKQRRYFIEGMKQVDGGIYLSEINLNREYGKVSQPHLEVLRTATPIYDERNGKIAGIVLITAQIGRELQAIHNGIHTPGRNIYITNDHGGYLLHPDKRKAYGFDLGKRYRMQEDIPQLAKLFLPDNQQTHLTLKSEHTKNKLLVNFTKIPFDEQHPERYIAVTLTQEYNSVVADHSKVLNDMSIWALLLALLSAGIAVLISIRITKPLKQISEIIDDFSIHKNSSTKLPVDMNDEVGKLARSFEGMIVEVRNSHKKLEQANNNLENQVEERTYSLQKSEAKQRTILNTIADGIITIDDHGLIDSFNPAAEKIFGFPADEVTGKNVSILLPINDRELHEEYTQYSSLNAPRIINRTRDLKGQRKDGSTFSLELNISPMSGTKSPVFVGVLRDITAREQAKQALLNARDEAENANRAKSQFLSSMSHELRTPLNAIIGFSQLLQMDPNNPLNKTQYDQVDEVLKGGNHLLELINEVLDLSQIESGRIDLSIEMIEIDDLIVETINLVSPMAKKHELNIFISINGSELSLEQLILQKNAVRGDRTRLKQVLLNLLSNAIKYNTPNGSVTIDLDTSNAENTRINIIDTGLGLTNDQQKQLFKPFNRLGAEQTEIEGTGIGLVITKNIIELMAGTIGVTSELEKGSTFWIELPADHTLSKENNASLKSDDIAQHTTNDKKSKYEKSVLYIEDNPTNLRLVNMLLSHQPNLHMWSAHEPFLGLELAIEHEPDLILLDINLPGMSGFEVLKHLKQHTETCDTPIIALSANAMPKDIEKGFAAGFDDYVTKPIDTKLLLDSINTHINNKKSPSEELTNNE